MKNLLFAVLLCLASTVAHAQTASTFSMTTSALALPGNHQTVSGAVSGLTFSPTPNFDFREDNITPNTPGALAFLGGVNYRLPAISRKVNNVSPNLNGYAFQFYLTGSLGVTRITQNGATVQHYAALAGAGMQYKLSPGGMWTLAFEARAARLPGMSNGWTAVVSLGPAIHF